MSFLRQWFWLFPLLLLPLLAFFIPNLDAQGAGDALKYLGIAWDMQQHHHYMLSLVNGVPYSDKPPLLFWLIIAFWHVFGDGTMLGPQCLISLMIIVWILLSQKTYAVIFSKDDTGKTLLPYVMLGSYALLDCLSMLRVDLLLIIAVLLINLGILTLFSSEKIFWRSVSYIVLGNVLGLFAKGPVIYLFTLAPYILCLLLWKNHRAHYTVILSTFFLSVCVFLVCWALPVALHAGDEYSKQIFFKQIAHRAASQHNNYFVYLYNNLPLLFLPWVVNIIFLKKIKAAFLELFKNSAFVWMILLITLAVFSLFAQKSIRYLLPWVSYGMIFWTRFFVHNKNDSHVIWFNRIILSCVFLLAAGLSLSLLLFPRFQALVIQGSHGEFSVSSFIVASFVVINCAFVAYLFFVRNDLMHLVMSASMAIVLFCEVFSVYGVVIVRQFTHMDQVRHYLLQPQLYDHKIALYHVQYYDGLFTYIARADSAFPVLKNMQSLQLWLQQNPRGLIITTKSCPNHLKLIMFYKERPKRPTYRFCQQTTNQ